MINCILRNLNLDSERKYLQPNAFKNTFCVFKEVLMDEINDKKIDFKSKAGSSYYYTKLGMFRLSNHWGRLANSKWRLLPLEPETSHKIKLGFAPWTDFYPDNTEDKLYYIETNFESKTVNYQHVNNPNYDKKAVLRSSFETTKKIKQIRNLLNLTSWAKHFFYDDIDVLRQKIIIELMYSDKTLEEIKRKINE